MCKHLHLPVQSGSTARAAARCAGATRARSISTSSQRLREALPDVPLSTDMIVGFPGETAEDFDDTLSLIEAVRYHSMFSFKYSPRPNTLAAQRMPDDVPEAEKTRAHHGAAGAAEGHPERAARSAPWAARCEVLVDTTSRRRDVGTGRPHERQHGGELSRATRVARPDRRR